MENEAAETTVDATARVADGGLKIDRRFTTEGIHPFDAIACDSRAGGCVERSSAGR